MPYPYDNSYYQPNYNYNYPNNQSLVQPPAAQPGQRVYESDRVYERDAYTGADRSYSREEYDANGRQMVREHTVQRDNGASPWGAPGQDPNFGRNNNNNDWYNRPQPVYQRPVYQEPVYQEPAYQQPQPVYVPPPPVYRPAPPVCYPQPRPVYVPAPQPVYREEVYYSRIGPATAIGALVGAFVDVMNNDDRRDRRHR